jgi:hypothetical protein
MSFAKTLLAGAAICALCTAPALAAPNAHVVGSGFDSPAKLIHSKTKVNPNKTPSQTVTFSFSATLSRAADFKVPVQFNQYTWQDTATCLPPTHQTFKVSPKKTAAAKIGVGSTTGATSACPSSIFTFSGPLYELKSKTATSDSFTAALIAHKYSGYTDILNENWAINIGA